MEHPSVQDADSQKVSEARRRREIESWDGHVEPIEAECPEVFRRVKAMAAAEGLDWLYMGEVGAGTGVAFYPPFQLMWVVSEQDLLRRWMEMVKLQAFALTEKQIAWGCSLIAMGGDVSGDKGPFLSPRHYHELILPVIREHIDLIHARGALAVYTSDGNHWPIKEDFFFNSHTDGYMEVDKAAGMTMERLIDEGVAERVCILGNVDARHTLCLGAPDQVEAEVRRCLELGRRIPGGHILHTSHSVHEDVRPENYRAMVAAYRQVFGLPALPR
jgi:uroporphyrinogen-III decarboxylase